MRTKMTDIGLCLTFALLVAGGMPAAAEVINFDAEAAARGGFLTSVPPLTIDIATFTGGE